MRQQVQIPGNKGMIKDLDISKFNPEFSFNNNNIRINNTTDGTLATIVSEPGNKLLDITGTHPNILGFCIGYCVIDNYLMLFTTNNFGVDRIYRLS